MKLYIDILIQIKTADSFQKYSYSNDSTDDINGTVIFKIDAKKGMAYSVENLVSAYKYYPDNSSTSAVICNINEDNIDVEALFKKFTPKEEKEEE